MFVKIIIIVGYIIFSTPWKNHTGKIYLNIIKNIVEKYRKINWFSLGINIVNNVKKRKINTPKNNDVKKYLENTSDNFSGKSLILEISLEAVNSKPYSTTLPK